MNTLHVWLGKEFRELLPIFREESREIHISLTRPYAHSYGKGCLRVIRVLDGSERVELLLAYENYGSPPRPKTSGGRKKGKGTELAV